MRKAVVAGIVLMIGWCGPVQAKDSIYGSLMRAARNIDKKMCETFKSSNCKSYRKQKTQRLQQKPKPIAKPVVFEPEEPKTREPVTDAVEPEATSASTVKIKPPRTSACLQNLTSAGVKFVPASVNTENKNCGINTPIRLMSVEFAGGKVSFPDLPVLSCSFALDFSEWTTQSAVRIAEKSAGSSLKWISTGPGYECRNRNRVETGKISEHARGNAVDISQFALQDGRTVKVRDMTNPDRTDFETLKLLRASACDSFATVLGPGSDGNHESHLHLDATARKSGYRICQ
jgi:hypothetical protein